MQNRALTISEVGFKDCLPSWPCSVGKQPVSQHKGPSFLTGSALSGGMGLLRFYPGFESRYRFQ